MPRVAAAEPDAEVAGPDARFEVPGAAAEAVEPLEGVGAPALLSAASDAAAVVKPGVGVQRVRPAAWALEPPPRVSLEEKRPLVFVPFQAFSDRPRLRHRPQAPPATWQGWSSQVCFQG